MDYTAAELDIKRKQFLFRLCAGIIIPAFFIFVVINYFEKDRIELIIDIAVILVLSSGLMGLSRYRLDSLIYRITHFIITLGIFYSVAISSGEETVLYWAFIMPLLFFYFFGKLEGLIWNVFYMAVLCIILLMPWLFNAHYYDSVKVSRFLIILPIITTIAYGLESSRLNVLNLLNERNRALMLEKQNLEDALAHIKTLSGLLPICASCKRIRDDKGYWNQLEKYFSEHSDLLFSHGICPECLEKLYRDYM